MAKANSKRIRNQAAHDKAERRHAEAHDRRVEQAVATIGHLLKRSSFYGTSIADIAWQLRVGGALGKCDRDKDPSDDWNELVIEALNAGNDAGKFVLRREVHSSRWVIELPKVATVSTHKEKKVRDPNKLPAKFMRKFENVDYSGPLIRFSPDALDPFCDPTNPIFLTLPGHIPDLACHS